MTHDLVLDPSAILAYTQRENAVADLLAVADRILLPALAVAETRAELAYREELHLLDLLTDRLPTVEIIPLPAPDAIGVGRLAALLDGRLGLAHAVAVACQHEARIVSAYGKAIRRAVGDLNGIVDL
jgi:PIN domain nuclease of toxin-antitoxin system